MEFITSAVLGGLLWDFIKYQAAPTVENIRETVSKVVNLDKTIESALSTELTKMSIGQCNSQNEVIQKLESSPQIQALINQLNQLNSPNVVVQTLGGGDAVYGDKVMGDKIMGNKVITDK
ncbi:hypothetical protein [Photobacterium galatheae]|uniref:Uncharacterized protein n=1 Tax=Photobacterium galatheae TaxID=1654360 RepID=A0A066RR01_9GAMM|nr:hypothetical protein [Photobacterium galatheae]KDM92875.1 hypothetical protein EA58_03730 [Photobacterium galatheae]MCM0148160.1 hypothetical protein [Photobacterium galatheae]